MKMRFGKIILGLKDGAPGYDDICVKPMVHTLDEITHPIVHPCNLSLSQGCFPEELKIAEILPLFKTGETTYFNNYRPISLLPVFSKIFERIMCNRLYSYLVKFCILYSHQFGFRKGYSTYMALICLVEKLTNAMEKGEYGIGIF